MKKHVSRILAFLMVFALIFSFAACGGEKGTTTAPANTTDAADVDATTADGNTATDETTTAVADVPSTDNNGEITTIKGSVPTTLNNTPAVTPSGKSAILTYFNDATAKAVSSKAGFKKVKTTAISSLEMGALARFKIVRTTIEDFLEVGTTTETAKKGADNSKKLIKSTLTASDISNAECKVSSDGKYYVITLKLVADNKPVKGASPLGRVTKDFNSAQELKDAINEEASVESVDEQIPSGTVEAKVEISSGKLSSLKVNFEFDVQMTNVKYFVKIPSGTGKATTTVEYSSFAW